MHYKIDTIISSRTSSYPTPRLQTVFAELRGNHFLDQLSTGWQYEIARTAEYKFVDCGLEVYYNGDVLDEFYVIVQGSVRVCVWWVYTYVFVCVYEYIHTCAMNIYIHTCMRLQRQTNIQIDTHIYAYIQTYIPTHKYLDLHT